MPPAELSATDHAIIEILQREGRTTYADIGSRVGVSATAAHERIKKLEARGVIRGYQAEIDPALVGAGVTAFIFVSQKAGPRGLVEELFADMPWVQECHHVAGEETLLLKVRAESMPALEHLVWEIRALDSVERTRTVVVLATVFENRPVAAATVDAPHARTSSRARWQHRCQARVLRHGALRSAFTPPRSPATPVPGAGVASPGETRP